MIEVTQYKTVDGYIYRDEKAAKRHEEILYRVQAALEKLPEVNLKYLSSGEGYYQHELKNVTAFRWAIYEIAQDVMKEDIKRQKEEFGKTDTYLAYKTHPSWFGRLLDGECPPLEKAYVRMACIDGLCREWEQPYFANNPNKDAVCINLENKAVINGFFPIKVHYSSTNEVVVVNSPDEIKPGEGFVVLETRLDP